MTPKGFHGTLEVAFPILIGSIPIGSSFSNLKERAFQAKKPCGAGGGGADNSTKPIHIGGALEMKRLFSESKEAAGGSQVSFLPQPKSHNHCPYPLKMDNQDATGNWDFMPLYSYYGAEEA